MIGTVRVAYFVFIPHPLGAEAAFLDTPKGKPYAEIFRHIRLQHVVKDLASAGILETDRVIPESEL